VGSRLRTSGGGHTHFMADAGLTGTSSPPCSRSRSWSLHFSGTRARLWHRVLRCVPRPRARTFSNFSSVSTVRGRQRQATVRCFRQCSARNALRLRGKAVCCPDVGVTPCSAGDRWFSDWMATKRTGQTGPMSEDAFSELSWQAARRASEGGHAQLRHNRTSVVPRRDTEYETVLILQAVGIH